MSPQYGWENCPDPVRMQLKHMTSDLAEILGESMVGIYLHGSLAMHCFNPTLSDLDILVVMDKAMTVADKRRVAEGLLELSRAPIPIEISFLVESAIKPWEHPALYDFHYSEAWRDRLTRDLETTAWQNWSTPGGWDPDLAAHITLTREYGIVLAGKPIAEVLPDIPPKDFIDSILNDFFRALDNVQANPDRHSLYFILNACRVYAFLLEGHLFSKDAGAVWSLKIIPEPHRPLVQRALDAYRGDKPFATPDEAALQQCIAYITGRMGPLLP